MEIEKKEVLSPGVSGRKANKKKRLRNGGKLVKDKKIHRNSKLEKNMHTIISMDYRKINILLTIIIIIIIIAHKELKDKKRRVVERELQGGSTIL